MKSLEDTLIEVWNQSLVENAKSVEVERQSYAIKRTARRGLKQVDFRFDGKSLRGLEQNPETKSRWQRWREKERRSCSSSKPVDILRSLLMGTCIFTRSLRLGIEPEST